MPPIWMPIEAKLAKPVKANAVSLNDRVLIDPDTPSSFFISR